MSAIRTLIHLLRDPDAAAQLPGDRWAAILSVARAEALLGTLAYRLEHQPIPPAIAALFAAARADAQGVQRAALWEAEMARRAFAPLGIDLILLKGTAYAAADLPNAVGRQIGDLDILVPRDRLAEAEAALISAGWEWLKDDPYDQAYYRAHMHELPPMIHGVRDRMIDVHHTILPLTARPRPDAAALIAGSIPLTDGLRALNPEDMIIHAAAHLIADGDMAGGLRNLWDIDRMVGHFARQPGFWDRLEEAMTVHDMQIPVRRALRLAAALYGTAAPLAGELTAIDRLYLRRLRARDDWGRDRQRGTRLAFYMRSHLLRMPPLMLARHLWVKWRAAHV